MKPSINAPKAKLHKVAPDVRQEENLVNLMKQKDSHHTNVIFKSEHDPYYEDKKLESPRKVNQPLIDPENRKRLLVLAKNVDTVNK